MHSRNHEYERTCAVCFERIEVETGLLEWFWYQEPLCSPCRSALGSIVKKIKLSSFTVLGLYPYKDAMRTLMLRYKEGKDRYLAPLFLSSHWLRLFFYSYGYELVCVPSSGRSQRERGFNAGVLMTKVLKRTSLDVLENTASQPQKEQSRHQRHMIKQHIHLKDSQMLNGKKILLFDDVLTTGATLEACYTVLKPHCKAIRVLVCCYHEDL